MKKSPCSVMITHGVKIDLSPMLLRGPGIVSNLHRIPGLVIILSDEDSQVAIMALSSLMVAVVGVVLFS